MATTTTFLQHPCHEKHALETRDFRKDSIGSGCRLCTWTISADGYACEACQFYAHRACAEAPPRIDLHPLHTDHPLTLLIRGPSPFNCDACGLLVPYFVTSFRCDECDFKLDIRCALSTLSDRGCTQGKTPEQIKLPFHSHPLTSFSTRHDFIGGSKCVICEASVEGDGYACLRPCEFLIHKRCIQDLYYTDGTRAPRIYHFHPLKTLLGEDMGSTGCANCGSDESSGEFIGCAECQVFYCRDCVQVPESIQYPHHPDHTLVLLFSSLHNGTPHCDSCYFYLKSKLYYGCPSCDFFVDFECALQFLSYSEEGMSAEIKRSWHEHSLLLCHKTMYDGNHCSYCEDRSGGPVYICKEGYCKFLIHKLCIEIESTIIHPHHPDHPLTLCQGTGFQHCEACGDPIFFLGFSCKLCAFYLHSKCASHFPTRKHSLHEHELLHLEKAPLWKCKRCGTSVSSPFFRCVPCDVNLHEECMELPLQVVNNKVHWHPLTLHETYIDDDSGEYYCDKCEKRRDERMGVYVCLQCSARWAYHIECIFPELWKVFVKEQNYAEIERLADDIARREEEVREAERKLDEMKRELDEQRKKHTALTVRYKGGFNAP